LFIKDTISDSVIKPLLETVFLTSVLADSVNVLYFSLVAEETTLKKDGDSFSFLVAFSTNLSNLEEISDL